MNINQKYKQYERTQEPYKLSAHLLALNLVKTHSKVLSIGCGAGREVKYLVQELKCDVTAVDNDPQMIELSKKNEPNAEYVLSGMEFLGGIGILDYVVCLYNTINYMSFDDRLRLILLAYQSLKKGGKLIITSSNAHSGWREYIKSFFDNYYYHPDQIDKWFAGTEFKVEKIKVGKYNLIVAEKR